jgi:hypothetical protein
MILSFKVMLVVGAFAIAAFASKPPSSLPRHPRSAPPKAILPG